MSTTTSPPQDQPTPEVRAAVAAHSISKHFGPVHALTDVSFELRMGEVLGLIGENGAGKSTLISILSGVIHPDSGTVTIAGEPVALGDTRGLSARGVAVVSQEQSLAPALKVYENLFLGHEDTFGRGPVLRRKRMRTMAHEVLAECGLSGLPANAPVSALSYPQRQLVEIAKAFAWAKVSGSRPIILLDEPTSGLSENEVELLFSLINRWRSRAAFIFVSHILRDVLTICTRLVVLKDGRFVKSVPAEGITDSDLHELMVGRIRSSDYYQENRQGSALSADVAVALHGASGDGFDEVDLQVRRGEVVGIAGVIGSGKSELAAAIAGAQRISAGDIRHNGIRQPKWSVPRAIDAGVFYIPPERATDSIFATRSVKHNIAIGFLANLRARRTSLIRSGREQRLAHQFATRMAVKCDSLSTPIGELSGGNQQKAVFARWLGRTCSVIVLDDPTRGIDVGSREQIYAHIRDLADEGAAVVLCSESLEELIGLSDRIVVMKDGRIFGEVPAPAGRKPDEVNIVQYMI
jgi:ribose transport system ATP-binding protein